MTLRYQALTRWTHAPALRTCSSASLAMGCGRSSSRRPTGSLVTSSSKRQGGATSKGSAITLIAADSPDSFLDSTPTAVLIRQVLGAVAQFEKAALVAKLRAARERKAKLTGQKVGGRKSVAGGQP